MRTIRVTGKGQIKVKPDMTRITITLEGLYPDYAETLRRSSEDTDSLKDVLSAFGFERTELKTLSFNVDTEYVIIPPLGTHRSATRKTVIRIKERTNPKRGTHQSAQGTHLPLRS